jgi:hypothetical protein
MLAKLLEMTLPKKPKNELFRELVKPLLKEVREEIKCPTFSDEM